LYGRTEDKHEESESGRLSGRGSDSVPAKFISYFEALNYNGYAEESKNENVFNNVLLVLFLGPPLWSSD
jgi:hypothetical protein